MPIVSSARLLLGSRSLIAWTMETSDGGARHATILDLLRSAVSARGDLTAVEAFDRSPLKYRALLAHVFDIVRALRARGLGPGDAVAIVLPDGPDLATAFLAV